MHWWEELSRVTLVGIGQWSMKRVIADGPRTSSSGTARTRDDKTMFHPISTNIILRSNQLFMGKHQVQLRWIKFKVERIPTYLHLPNVGTSSCGRLTLYHWKIHLYYITNDNWLITRAQIFTFLRNSLKCLMFLWRVHRDLLPWEVSFDNTTNLQHPGNHFSGFDSGKVFATNDVTLLQLQFIDEKIVRTITWPFPNHLLWGCAGLSCCWGRACTACRHLRPILLHRAPCALEWNGCDNNYPFIYMKTTSRIVTLNTMKYFWINILKVPVSQKFCCAMKV